MDSRTGSGKKTKKKRKQKLSAGEKQLVSLCYLRNDAKSLADLERGGARAPSPPTHAPKQDPILSFSHTILLKSARQRSALHVVCRSMTMFIHLLLAHLVYQPKSLVQSCFVFRRLCTPPPGTGRESDIDSYRYRKHLLILNRLLLYLISNRHYVNKWV